MQLKWTAVALAALGGGLRQEEEAAAPAAAPHPPLQHLLPQHLRQPKPSSCKIGHVGPTGGAIAHLGKDNELGAKMTSRTPNAKQLKIGDKVAKFELVAEDDAGDPKQGTAVAQKLVDEKVVVGHLNSGTTIPASKLYSDAGILDLARNPQVHPPGLQDRLPCGGRRHAAGRHARQVRRRNPQRQEHRGDRRPHGLRPGRRRGSSRRRRRPPAARSSAMSSRPTSRPTSTPS